MLLELWRFLVVRHALFLVITSSIRDAFHSSKIAVKKTHLTGFTILILVCDAGTSTLEGKHLEEIVTDVKSKWPKAYVVSVNRDFAVIYIYILLLLFFLQSCV